MPVKVPGLCVQAGATKDDVRMRVAGLGRFFSDSQQLCAIIPVMSPEVLRSPQKVFIQLLLCWMGGQIFLIAACGGGSGSVTDSGVDATGSDLRLGVRSDLILTAPATGCGGLTCTGEVDNLLAACEAEGSCIKQTTSTGEIRCFGNGVKFSKSSQKASTAAGVSSSIIVSAKKDGTVCYTKTFSSLIPAAGGAAAASSTLTITDGAGTIVATNDGDATGKNTVTCPGGVATEVDDACFSNLSAYIYYSGVPAACTEGACTF